MERNEFVGKYLSLVEGVIRSKVPDIDLKKAANQQCFYWEEELIEQAYYSYVSDHGRKPDYAFLMDCVTDFGMKRLDLFDKNERQVSCDQFVAFYIDQLEKSQKLLVTDYSFEDYRFILKRERYMAEKYFNEKKNNSPLYKELNIETSKKAQEMLLNVLNTRFQHDLESFYHGMKSKRGA